jgi:hypothetical protein
VSSPKLAVCLHDVEPGTLDRCRFIRGWLSARGVERMTLLAIPAGRSGDLLAVDPCAGWLRERTAAGDAVAQHGLHHRRSDRANPLRSWIADRQGGDAAEFVGLDPAQTAWAVNNGRSILQAAGLQPRGFVAPAYAYTRTLRRELRRQFDWYGGLLTVHGRRRLCTPAHGLGTSTELKRRTSPMTLRAGSSLPGEVLRVDVHPADFDLPGHVAALDAVLSRRRLRTVSYDDLCG